MTPFIYHITLSKLRERVWIYETVRCTYICSADDSALTLYPPNRIKAFHALAGLLLTDRPSLKILIYNGIFYNNFIENGE